jgi:hypothetical protein
LSDYALFLLRAVDCDNIRASTNVTDLIPTFHKAAVEGDIATLRRLLNSGVPVDVPAPGGYSALMIASCAGQADAVRLLLERGANLGARDNSDKFALLYAALKEAEVGDRGIVSALPDAGVDVNATNSWGETALIWSAGGPHSTELVRLLLERGGAVNAVNGYRQSALMQAAESGREATVELLLSYGADRSQQDDRCNTAAQLARDHGFTTVADRLDAHSYRAI